MSIYCIIYQISLRSCKTMDRYNFTHLILCTSLVLVVVFKSILHFP